MGALAGVIGSMMALEAVKLIAGAGAPLTGRLLIYDALAGRGPHGADWRRSAMSGVRVTDAALRRPGAGVNPWRGPHA